MVSGTILRNILQWSCSSQCRRWAVGVVFVQKIHKFSVCSDDSICTQVSIKFLSETHVTSIDFAVVCWFYMQQDKQKKLQAQLHKLGQSIPDMEHFRLILIKIQQHQRYLLCCKRLHKRARLCAQFRRNASFFIVISLYFLNLNGLTYLSNLLFFLHIKALLDLGNLGFFIVLPTLLSLILTPKSRLKITQNASFSVHLGLKNWYFKHIP